MSIYTDLAMEARELSPDIDGVTETTEDINGVRISEIQIETEAAAQALGKPMGRYITLDCPKLIDRDTEDFKELSRLVAREVGKLLGNLNKTATVLVAGLGNRYITPDSLGPRVTERVYVTRPLTTFMPEALDKPLMSVCAIAPGVLGVTGVETYDVISGVAEKLKPDAVIIIDSLASRRAARISTTVQITDTGISPGSGVGNGRADLTKKSLGIPVIALGVPMVVYASTIAQDTIALIADKTGLHNDEEKLKSLAGEVISDNMGEFIVTPKDIDSIVDDMSGIVADGLNLAMHGDSCEYLAELMA